MRLRQVSFGGWLGSASEIRWGVRPSWGSSESCCCFSALKGVSWAGSGIWLRRLLLTYLWKDFWAYPSGRRPQVRPRSHWKNDIPSGRRTLWDPAGETGECRWEDGCLGFPPGPIVSMIQPQISRRRWMEIISKGVNDRNILCTNDMFLGLCICVYTCFSYTTVMEIQQHRLPVEMGQQFLSQQVEMNSWGLRLNLRVRVRNR